MPEYLIEELIVLQLEGGTGELWNNAIHLCHSYYLQKDGNKHLPKDLIFNLLTHELMADGRVAHEAAYYWSRLAEAFIRQHPERTWEFFELVLRAGTRECAC